MGYSPAVCRTDLAVRLPVRGRRATLRSLAWAGVLAVGLAIGDGWAHGADPGSGRGGHAGTQAPGSALRAERLASWTEAVANHGPGESDSRAWLVAPWSEDDLVEVQSDFFSLLAIYARADKRRAGHESIRHKDTQLPVSDIPRRLGLTPDEAAEGNANRVLRRACLGVRGRVRPPDGVA